MAKKKNTADESLARKIWLAGLGAYGRAFSDATEGMAKVSQETLRRFDDLAERGADLEDKAGGLINEKVTLFDRPPLEERLSQFRKAFGFADESDPSKATASEDDVAALKAQIAALEAQVDALSANAQSSTKKTAKKTKQPAKKAPRRAAAAPRKKTD